MALLNRDGSELSWRIEQSARGGFDVEYRVNRRVKGSAYTETDARHFHSREAAVTWLRSEAAIRGFDGREIR